MFSETIKKDFSTIAKRDEDEYCFYPRAHWRAGAISIFIFSTFIALIWFYFLDFHLDFYLSLVFLSYTSICLFMILKSFDYVLIGADKARVKNLFYFKNKQEVDMGQVQYMLREIERVVQGGSRYRRSIRVVNYYFILKDGEKIPLLKKIIEMPFNKYDNSVEQKVDYFVKCITADYGLEWLLQDIDYENMENDLGLRTTFIRGMLRIDQDLSPERQQGEKERLIKVKLNHSLTLGRNMALTASLFIVVAGINICRQGYHTKNILVLLGAVIILYLASEEYRKYKKIKNQ